MQSDYRDEDGECDLWVALHHGDACDALHYAGLDAGRLRKLEVGGRTPGMQAA